MTSDITAKQEKKIGGWKRSILDFFDIFAFLILIAGIAALIRFFVFMPYSVEGSSMADTFHEKDFILVEKITPKFGTIKRGDVVVFIPPGKTIPFIKRIIGLPGERIKLIGGDVYVCAITDNQSAGNTNQSDFASDSCIKLDESYLGLNGNTAIQTEAKCGITTFDVVDGYFLLGDNRGFSTDSRCCFGLGCTDGAGYTIGKERIIGKVFARVFPSLGSFANQSIYYNNIPTATPVGAN